MPPSVGELAESVGVLLEGPLEGGGDGGVAEAGGGVCGDGPRFTAAFAAAAGFFGGGDGLGGGDAFFGAGLRAFDEDFAAFTAFTSFFATAFAAFAGLDGFFAAAFFAC